MNTPTVAVVIPHFWEARTGNLLSIVQALQTGSVKPAEIIIWNNDVPNMPHLPGVTLIQSSKNVGCKARFLAAMCATADYVLFQDNDVLVQPDGLMQLFRYNQPGSVTAFEGRRLVRGLPYESCEFLDGARRLITHQADITIGRCELIHRGLLNELLGDFPFKANTVMDDIWFSYVLDHTQHPVWVVPYDRREFTGFINLDQCGVGAYLHPEHMHKRDALCHRLFPHKM